MLRVDCSLFASKPARSSPYLPSESKSTAGKYLAKVLQAHLWGFAKKLAALLRLSKIFLPHRQMQGL